ncbi:hypothetical protein HDV01_002593 [Terramyces sp. JEL0728]|nr:hypothetical protein HDV01_002593 [Terramyces sp. JEL0728]
MKKNSILKRPTDSQHGQKGIRWDEDNLAITEAQKDSTMKILEPKTPYIHYDASMDELKGTSSQGVPPMELERAINLQNSLKRENSQEIPFDVDKQLNISSKEHDWSEDEEDPKEKQKHQRFKKMRAEHYDMKEVLSHAKDLLESELEDENINDPNKYEVEEAQTPNVETDSEDELSNNHTRN